jgi:hypothetical protein
LAVILERGREALRLSIQTRPSASVCFIRRCVTKSPANPAIESRARMRPDPV